MNECELLFVCLFDVRSTRTHINASLSRSLSLSLACCGQEEDEEECVTGADAGYFARNARLVTFSARASKLLYIRTHTHWHTRRQRDRDRYTHIYIFVNIFPHNWYAALHIQTHKCRPWFSRCVADNSQFTVHYIQLFTHTHTGKHTYMDLYVLYMYVCEIHMVIFLSKNKHLERHVWGTGIYRICIWISGISIYTYLVAQIN